jgi:hypothetical protein
MIYSTHAETPPDLGLSRFALRAVSLCMGTIQRVQPVQTAGCTDSGSMDLIHTYQYLTLIRKSIDSFLCTYSVAELEDLGHEFVESFIECYKLLPHL